ncbi:efflux RND transporter permease subunit [Robertkochia flava]|uniref:efflux RND transporter permease subunit n=1 Tax=Robertkochia flava TaxID=3447986 RepID=UPI001CCDE6B1|nr:efflux RND transporter permease subunit [Robertkochia marina]
MFKTFIERPVLSTVISIIIIILGVLGLLTLPVEQYPDIAPPTVRITANYPGASAETVIESVVIPIEEQVNGVEGMTYMTSRATNNGGCTITVYFEQGVNPDIAAVNVQNKVAQATAFLPPEVVKLGVITRKQQTSALMFLSVYSTTETYDETFITNYLNINVVPAFKRISGVGDVRAFSDRNYSMRIWLKPEKMAAYNLQPSDIAAVLNEQSLEAAPGYLGESSGETYSYKIRYSGRFRTQEQYENIIIKALSDGQFLRLRDVADIKFESYSYSYTSYTNGYPSIVMAVYQVKGSNAQALIEDLKGQLEILQKDFPEGLEVDIAYDTNQFLEASIEKVVHTLFEAFALVFLVVFIFLQDFRSTLIPAIAVPVSIIGAFFFLKLFGYSVNLLTLFALILAIGVVVDDAIVVVEAVHSKLEEGAANARIATLEAMEEITPAVISMTLVMAAVFVPVTFLTGPTGVFYKQFGVTLVMAIFVSAINALTLSPALSALLLKPHHHKEGAKRNILQRFFDWFNRGFEKFKGVVGNALGFLVAHKWIVLTILALAVAGIVWTSKTTKSGFVPNEDRGMVFVDLQLPPGSSLDRTDQVLKELNRKVRDIPGVTGTTLVGGFSVLSGAGSNFGLGMIKFLPWEEREADSLSVESLLQKLFAAGASIPEANIIFFSPPSVPGFGAASGFEVNLLDRSGGSFENLSQANDEFLQALNASPAIKYARASFDIGYPQYELEINVPAAKQRGVAVSNILTTIQGYIGGVYAADFARFGRQFRVRLQAYPEDRSTLSDFNQLYVRNDSGNMAPVSEFVTLRRVYGPQAVDRFNLFNSTKITGESNPGFSTGDAIAVIEAEASRLGSNFSVDYSGLTREEVSAGSQAILVFILCLIFTYLFLAAQYESYLLPFAILLSLPIGILGGFLFTKFLGYENNVFFQIALILLVGLLAKNAILVVEFALLARKKGMGLTEAAIKGAVARVRPIFMTSFAFVLGLLPLAVATGAGAAGNRSIGTGAAGGMLVGTVFGIFVVSVLFVIFQWLQEKIVGLPKELREPAVQEPAKDKEV